MRDVVLVFGAPCAGKSTYVRDQARPGDIVIDLDLLAQEAGSPVTHDHAPHFLDAASRARARLESRVAQSSDVRAWVVRTGGRPLSMDRLSRRLRATEVVVLDPGFGVCLDRARAAGRSGAAVARIVQWYRDRDTALNGQSMKGGRKGRR